MLTPGKAQLCCPPRQETHPLHVCQATRSSNSPQDRHCYSPLFFPCQLPRLPLALGSTAGHVSDLLPCSICKMETAFIFFFTPPQYLRDKSVQICFKFQAEYFCALPRQGQVHFRVTSELTVLARTWLLAGSRVHSSIEHIFYPLSRS